MATVTARASFIGSTPGRLLLFCLLACGGGATDLLAPGAPAPDVVGEGPNGESVRLSSRAGQPSVVYFYPKDDTPGCTKEACAFRDAFDRYVRAGVTIFGVSGDDAASHRAFRKKHRLPFPLVADTEGAVQRAYGVSSRLGMPARVTFVVGRDGKVARVFRDVDPGVHEAEVFAALQGL
jgi:peroxiredoxin Q/BCP